MTDEVAPPVRVGVLVPPKIAPNMIAVLENLGRMVGEEVSLDLIQAGRDVPHRLQASYRVCQYRRLRLDRSGLMSSFRACYRYASREEPDMLMNVAQPQTLGFFVGITGRRFRIPTVVRMTGETFRQAELARTWIDRLKVAVLHGLMARLAYRYATLIVAVGSRLRDSLIAQGYPTEKIWALPQPFDPQAFQPVEFAQKRKLKHQLGLNQKTYTVLYVGRLSWLKGADRLLSIIRGVARANRGYQFCVIGRGELESKFHQFPDYIVHSPGSVTRDRIAKYYWAADLLVFPSRTEGLPNVILEGLAAALPIIASPVGEIPEYVSDLAYRDDDFVDYILNQKWEPNHLPESLAVGEQRHIYSAMIRCVSTSDDSSSRETEPKKRML